MIRKIFIQVWSNYSVQTKLENEFEFSGIAETKICDGFFPVLNRSCLTMSSFFLIIVPYSWNEVLVVVMAVQMVFYNSPLRVLYFFCMDSEFNSYFFLIIVYSMYSYITHFINVFLYNIPCVFEYILSGRISKTLENAF